MALKVNIDKYFIRHNYFLFFFVDWLAVNVTVKKCNTDSFCHKFSTKCEVHFKVVI